MENLFAKDCNLCMFTWLKVKSKFNFETMKTHFILIVNQSHYINLLFTLMYFVDQIMSKEFQ